MTSCLSLKSTAAALVLLLSALAANAEVKMIEVNGASRTINIGTITDKDNTTPRVFGGRGGSEGTCVMNSDGTCNNCTNVPINTFTATPGTSGICNTHMVLASTPLIIRFTSAKNGYPIITNNEKTSAIFTSSTLVSSGQTAEIRTTWGNICNNSGLGAGCNVTGGTVATVTLQVGITQETDSDLADAEDEALAVTFVLSDVFNTGTLNSAMLNCQDPDTKNSICDFAIQSGDAKAVLTNLGEFGDFPTLSGTQVRFMRVYFEPCTWTGSGVAAGGFDTISAASSFADLPITLNASGVPELLENEITGMQNGVTYCAKIAHVDDAMNVGMFTPQSGDNQCTVNYLRDSSGGEFPGTCHIARPDEVLGVLSENCFIATAAYGSKWALKVQTFRDFRNQFLLSNSWGKKFVRFYYKQSPQFARMIAQSESARGLARVVLSPLWLFAKSSLKIGFLPTLLFTLGIMTTPLVLFFRRRKHKAA